LKKKILITGLSGFLGSELKKIISENFIGLGTSSSNEIVCDISVNIPKIDDNNFFRVIHCAGKAHYNPVNESKNDIFEKVNVTGTANLLQSLENKIIEDFFIYVSSVSVYGVSKGEKIDENHKCNPNSPYALSKLKAENLIINWCKRKNIKYLILRLPLIYGENPKGNLKLITDYINNGIYVSIINNNAKKSIVLAEDIAILLNHNNLKGGIFNLTDDYDPTLNEIENAISKLLKTPIIFKIPLVLLKILLLPFKFIELLGFKLVIGNNKLRKLTTTLTFSCDKAKKDLNWKPRKVINHI